MDLWTELTILMQKSPWKIPGFLELSENLCLPCAVYPSWEDKVNAIDRFAQHSKCGGKSPNERLEFPFFNLSRLNHTSGFTGKNSTSSPAKSAVFYFGYFIAVLILPQQLCWILNCPNQSLNSSALCFIL